MTPCACGCGKPVAKRKGAKYASARCRANHWRDQRKDQPMSRGYLRSRRVLKSGTVSLLIHLPVRQEAFRTDSRPEVRVSLP